ncbi:LacI family DNA-binding transcriptional regulator [Paramicrobacterium chengjingii]|uniref:LacI family DNA-binding transcriptional regulator n=1 Tax=Paramicrobacterium chengjingii TaxID=2769067 RepID=A0ABX6YGL0_9MICO|nr:LacI family DNA-binding transcriptional regulator [Microbacterium chengjingii]QPZ37576.1 LacI family DNA-binding transcriptional regulator [Microbacterium chengjingii]
MVPNKRITIADIAKLAGVSPGAVSFALNDRPGVSDETRKRILAVAAEHQWVPNSAARALVGSHAGVVGLVVERPARSLGAEAFFTDLISGIQSGLAPSAAAMQMRVVRSLDDEVDTYRAWHSSKQVDGVIVLDPRDDDPRLDYIAQVNLPAIVIGSHPSRPDAPSAVWMDDAAAAHMVFDYLVALGHRSIGYVAGPEVFEHTTLRADVLRSFIDDGVESTIAFTDFSAGRAANVTRQLMSGRTPPSAVVFDNDVMAVAGLRVAQEMGISVPARLSVASFDDSIMAGLVSPSITCLSRDTFALGELAATTLLSQIAEPVRVDSVPGPTPSLTVRESTSPPSERRG